MALSQLSNLGKKIIEGPERVAILNNSGIEIIQFDATPSIRHSKSNQISSYPIESGAMISDHITRENNTIDLDCVISNANQNALKRKIDNSLIGAANAFLGTNLIPTIAPSILGLLENTTDKRNTSYKVLEGIRLSNELYKLRTGLEIYDNLILKTINYQESVAFGGALSFTVSFEQLKIVQTQSVDALTIVEKVNSTASKEVNKGDNDTKVPDENVSRVTQSRFAAFLDKVF